MFLGLPYGFYTLPPKFPNSSSKSGTFGLGLMTQPYNPSDLRYEDHSLKQA
jgi:hypothetical protein